MSQISKRKIKGITCIMLIIMLSFSQAGTLVHAESDEPSSWAVSAIEEVKDRGILGTSAFKKYQTSISREEFIYIAVRLYETLVGSPVTINKNIRFTDTDDTYALKGATVGITSGIGNNMFGPNQLLTREQLAVLMINTLELSGADISSPSSYRFTDEGNFSSWAYEDIYKAKANGIVNGVGQDRFDSKGTATTEQALIIMNNILKAYFNKIDKDQEVVRVTSTGGSFTYDDVTVTVPSGAVSSNEVFRIVPVEQEELPQVTDDLELLGALVEVKTSAAELKEEVKITLPYDEGMSPEELVVLHFGEQGYIIEPGEFDENNHTVTVSVDSFSPFGVFSSEAGKELQSRLSLLDSDEYIQVNHTYDMEEPAGGMVVYDENNYFFSRDYWGVIDDPTGYGKGKVAAAAAMHNGKESKYETGYASHMDSCIEFVYENNDADVDKLELEFDAYVKAGGKTGLLNADWLEVQVRASNLTLWTPLIPEGNIFKYVNKTDGWATVTYDLTDIKTVLTLLAGTEFWGDSEYPHLYIRIKFNSGMDSAPSRTVGGYGAYVDNIRLNKSPSLYDVYGLDPVELEIKEVSGVNRLVWNDQDKATNYLIQRSVNGGSFQVYQMLDKPSRNYYILDDEADGSSYEYRMVAYNQHFTTQPSNIVSSEDAQQEQEQVYVSGFKAVAGDEYIQLSWNGLPAGYSYYFYRKSGYSSYSRYYGMEWINSSMVIDQNVDENVKYSYMLKLVNSNSVQVGSTVYASAMIEGSVADVPVEEPTSGGSGSASISNTGDYYIQHDIVPPNKYDYSYSDVCQLSSGDYAGIGYPIYYDNIVLRWDRFGNLDYVKELDRTVYASVGTADDCTLYAGPSDDGNHTTLYKINASGNIVWEKEIRYASGVQALTRLSDNSFLLATYRSDGNWVGLTKISQQGEKLEAYSYGDFTDVGKVAEIYEDNSSNIIMLIHGSDDHKIAKLNSSGEILWVNEYDDLYEIRPDKLVCADDGGYVFVGDSFYITAMKLTANGSVDWELRVSGDYNFSGTSNYVDRAIVETSEGYYVELPGHKIGVGSSHRYKAVIDDDGNLISSQITDSVGGHMLGVFEVGNDEYRVIYDHGKYKMFMRGFEIE